jgi:hypothetical protein
MFETYGFSIHQGYIQEAIPKPDLYGKTPRFNYTQPDKYLLESSRYFLEYLATKDTDPNTLSHTGDLLKIVQSIFFHLTGLHYERFVHIYVLKTQDFRNLIDTMRVHIDPQLPPSEKVSGVQYLGFSAIENVSARHFFSVAFHEIGHALYISSPERHMNECQGYYFESLCMRLLVQEILKLKILYAVPTEHKNFCTEYHRFAYGMVEKLCAYQRDPTLINTDEKRKEFKTLYDIVHPSG